ncbi:hypothetical protein FG386_000686 [Cryptosporidium ryanae]|uniref:uncharacterized protein n=1 Tax=Cryptosporidium ryanae TaxID=515981 RepID=UPI00351A5324|nr:hypothetical protein FG386_000686 [Cryptosporidium ryanae]
MSEDSTRLIYENSSERASGRKWKDTPNLKSRLKRNVTGKRKSYEERVKEKRELQRVRGIEKEAIMERVNEAREARERKRQKAMRRMNNEIVSSGVQVVTRTDKIRNWNKKARRMLRKVSLESLNM